MTILEQHPPTLVKVKGRNKRYLAYDISTCGRYRWCLLAQRLPNRGASGGTWVSSDRHEGWMPVPLANLTPAKVGKGDVVAGATDLPEGD